MLRFGRPHIRGAEKAGVEFQAERPTSFDFLHGVRQQVELDIRFGKRYRFAGEGVKQYAEEPSRGNGAAAIAFHAD